MEEELSKIRLRDAPSSASEHFRKSFLVAVVAVVAVAVLVAVLAAASHGRALPLYQRL